VLQNARGYLKNLSKKKLLKIIISCGVFSGSKIMGYNDR
jgi:hypothetical protein